MKKILIGIISVSILFLNGCEHWGYRTQTKAINNLYFQSEVILEDDECMIVKNKVTNEYFILTSGSYGVSLCPIEVNNDLICED